MNVKIYKNKDFTEIVICTEKLDDHIALVLKSKLVLTASKGEKNIILDARECIECDMAGISAFLVADRLCKNANGTFVVTGINDNVYQLIKVAQLENVLNMAENISIAEQMIKTQERA